MTKKETRVLWKAPKRSHAGTEDSGEELEEDCHRFGKAQLSNGNPRMDVESHCIYSNSGYKRIHFTKSGLSFTRTSLEERFVPCVEYEDIVKILYQHLHLHSCII